VSGPTADDEAGVEAAAEVVAGVLLALWAMLAEVRGPADLLLEHPASPIVAMSAKVAASGPIRAGRGRTKLSIAFMALPNLRGLHAQMRRIWRPDPTRCEAGALTGRNFDTLPAPLLRGAAAMLRAAVRCGISCGLAGPTLRKPPLELL
jgi:hypothetical protein